jgi:hypothetical protein
MKEFVEICRNVLSIVEAIMLTWSTIIAYCDCFIGRLSAAAKRGNVDTRRARLSDADEYEVHLCS